MTTNFNKVSVSFLCFEYGILRKNLFFIKKVPIMLSWNVENYNHDNLMMMTLCFLREDWRDGKWNVIIS